MKTTNDSFTVIADDYNRLVKSKYKIDEQGAEFLIDNELNTEDADIAYHEISSNMTKSGHAEIFEPL